MAFKLVIYLAFFAVALAAVAPPSVTTTAKTTTKATTVTTTTKATTATTTTAASSTSAYATKVKALISAGTCASVTTTSTICGNASISSSYYETFVYNNYRVVIISGVPNHAAEYNQTSVNPNTRCVRYQYFAAPATPTKSSSFGTTSMGAIAFMTTGTVLYNPLSGTDGSLASYYEWSTLDPCYGHSSADKQYHYHAVSGTCITGATTSSPKTLIGYAVDGYPVYGYASNTAGTTLKSCWTTTASTPTNMANYTYDTTGYSSGSCHLDKANGYTFSDGTYGYVMVSTNYYVPYYYAGSQVAKICGFTP